ncbi:MAG: hypothetical protein V4648_08480 [Bacteroidota bacterium]
MKRIIVLVLLVLAGTNSFSQKKKKAVAKKPVAGACISKLDNLTVEVKSGNFQITIAGKGKATDAIIVKSSDAGGAPSDCKLSSFTASGTKLYLLQWTEKSQIKTGNKTENKTTIYSTVYEITNKKQLFSNTQVTNHITEIVSLGGTAATETQERIRREGFEFILNADGTFTQKNKTQENKWVYDTAKMEFVDAKKKK